METRTAIKMYALAVEDEKSAINEEQHTVRFAISGDEIDRDGEIVTVQAVKDAIPGFAANPVALRGHNHYEIIGSWRPETFRAYRHHSEMDLQFAVDTELGSETWKLCRAKHMRAVSIGFRILEAHPEDIKGTRVLVITKIELFEISVVAVGANRRALAKALLENGGLDDVLQGERVAGGAKGWEAAEERIAKILDEFAVRLTDQLDEIKDGLYGDRDGYAELMLGKDSDLPVDRAGEDEAEKMEADDALEALERLVTKRNAGGR